MKKIVILFILVGVIFSFDGCISGNDELKDRLVIQGIGVDYENGKYILTLQSLCNNGNSDSAEGQQGGNIDIFTVEGDTVAKALYTVADTTGRNPLFSQNKIIVFGKSTRENKIPQILDYFSREYTLRINVIVAVTDLSAYEIMKTDGENGETGSKALVEIIETGIKNSICVNSEIYRIINGFNEKTSSTLIPVLSVEKNTVNGKNAVYLGGTAVYKDKNYVFTVSQNETVMLNIVNNNVKRGILAYKIGSKEVCVEIVSLKSKRKFTFENNSFDFAVNTKCLIDVLEYGDGDDDSIDEKSVEEISGKTQEYINDNCKKLFEKMKNNGCDGFRFLRTVGVKNSKLYFEIEDDYDNAYKNSDIFISTKVTVRRIGQNTIEKKVK